MEDRTILNQLDDNLWTTKGVRFTAHSRLMKKSRISNITIGILTCYLIVLGLMSVYNIIEPNKVDSNYLAFGSTAISILVLLFSQIEVANDYKVRAIQHHTCALKIADLHREIKTFGAPGFSSCISVYSFYEPIYKEYSRILETFENHKTSDYKKFMSFHSNYFKISCRKKIWYIVAYYLEIYWFYTLLIIVPLYGFYWLLQN